VASLVLPSAVVDGVLGTHGGKPTTNATQSARGMGLSQVADLLDGSRSGVRAERCAESVRSLEGKMERLGIDAQSVARAMEAGAYHV